MYVVYSSITCQYKDIPVWSVTAGRPEDRMIKDRVTYSTKDPEKI